MSVSIPSIHLTAKERIVGFEIHIQSGMIAQLPKVPRGWGISIDNDPSWMTSMKGNLAVGSAALSPDFFHDFVVVEQEAPPFNLPLEISGTVLVTEDFVTQRTINLEMKDFHLRRVGMNKAPASE